MSDYLPTPGATFEELDTPALLIDLPIFEQNLKLVADFYADKEAKVRPHIKGHKSPEIARLQLEAGSTVGGVCAAKLGEAETMVKGGIDKVLIFNEITSPPKMRRLTALAKRGDITVAVDDPGNVEELSEAAQAAGVTIGACVEVSVGIDRCGIAPGSPGVDLARAVMKAPGLHFAGLLGYEGSIPLPDFEERSMKTRERIQRLLDTREMVETAGLHCEIVGGGGTTTWNITGTIPGMTEVQPGRYVTSDLLYQPLGDFEVSVKILATVISRPRKGLAIIDCGHKASHLNFSGHATPEKYPILAPEYTGYPEVESPLGARVVGLDAEHGRIELEGDAEQLRRGDKVVLLAGYHGAPLNQHSYYLGVRDDIVETVWDTSGINKYR
jgi:D-serine deaminase-like pyridoxal phosphate-dependent protein